MPAELCFDPSKVLQQDCPTKESKSLEVATESSMISAEQNTAVDFNAHQNVSGVLQPDGDYTENGQLSGELTDRDEPDCFESGSQSDFDLERSESFSISHDFVHSIENNECSELSAESTISDQTVEEEPEPETYTLFQAMPDLCLYYEQLDNEIQELVLSDLEMVYEHETESKQPSEEDSGDEDFGEIVDLYEQYSEEEQNMVFELDKESFEQCELTNQSVLSECHATHFKFSEMCQASKESRPAELSGSLEQPPPAEQKGNVYDSELIAENSQESCTDSFESSIHSQLSDDFAELTLEQNQNFKYHTEQDSSQLSLNEIESEEMLEQCSSCAKYFEKCEIPEQCEPSEPAQNSEDQEQSEPFENSPELCEAFGTQCSVFHTSELPREKPFIEHSANEVKKRLECDMMFIGSMETFEARWLSQFLAVDSHQNNTSEKQEVGDLSVAVSEPRDELLPCDTNADVETVTDPPETSLVRRTLCAECEMREKAQLSYNISSQLFELCDVTEGTCDYEFDEDGETVEKRASTDEEYEEEYADCVDSKSQGSAETDESFRSFVDEPDEIYPVQTDDGIPSFEKDDCCTSRPTQDSLEVSDDFSDIPDLYTSDGVETHENTLEFRSEPESLVKQIYKTYAEVLRSGLCVETEPCLENEMHIDEEDYELNDEDIGEDQDQDLEIILEEETLIESHGEMIVPDSSERASEIYGLLTVDESIYKRDAADPCSIQSTCHEEGILVLDARDDNITESALSEEFTEFPSPVEKGNKPDLVSPLDETESANANEESWSDSTDDAQINEEQNKLEVLDEGPGEGVCGSSCGEIELCEDVSTFTSSSEEDVADDEKCIELNESDDPQNSADDLQIVRNAIDVQPDEELSKDPEPPGCRDASLDSTNGGTTEKDDFPPQSECNEKLDEIIHQVERSRTDEQSEPEDFFKLAGESASSEQIEAFEDTEASDDEDYPDFCDCEFCVQSVEQVPAKPLLPQIKSKDAGKICVVIDLDETLVHSSFKPVNNADFIIPVEIDGSVHQVYVLKRPHVDEFLKRMGELFECVLFTASLAKYADPVSDLLDKWGAFRCRLFRESCVFHRGNYVKDLSRLGRDLNKVIIVDNSPASYIFHPDNAVPVASWFDDMSDTELLDLIPFFERLSKVDDVYAVLKQQRTSS
ncbi:uncharacterized protein Hap1MRO34_007078 [Clarias gariepinus]